MSRPPCLPLIIWVLSGTLASPAVEQDFATLCAEAHLSTEATQTTVQVGSGVLRGRLRSTGLTVVTPYGRATLAISAIRGIQGGDAIQRPVRVFCLNGEVLAGQLAEPLLDFENETGQTTALDTRIFRLLIQPGAASPNLEAAIPFLADLSDGNRLACTDLKPDPLPLATPWGRIDLPSARLLLVQREDQRWLTVTGTEGSRLPAALTIPTLDLVTQGFGKITVPTVTIERLVHPVSFQRPAWSFRLAGGYRLAGTLGQEELPFAGLKVDPRQVVRISVDAEAIAEQGPRHEIQFVDGVIKKGRFETTRLEAVTVFGRLGIPLHQLLTCGPDTVEDDLRKTHDPAQPPPPGDGSSF